MLNIKKPLLNSTINFIVFSVFILLLNNIAYCMDLSKQLTLRMPLSGNTERGKERLRGPLSDDTDNPTSYLAAILSGIAPEEAVREARLILANDGRYLYSGDYYIAISSCNKEEALIDDQNSLPKEEERDGIIAGFGDSDADISFLGTERLKGRHYLPFYLSELSKLKLPSGQTPQGIIQTKKGKIDGAKAVLELMVKAQETNMTYEAFYKQLGNLVEGRVRIPTHINTKSTFKIDTVYADKDKTLTLFEGKPDSDIQEYICKMLINGTRFIIVSSNNPNEIKQNLIEPIKDNLSRRLTGEPLDAALSNFKVYYDNSLGPFNYHRGTKDFTAKANEGKEISDNVKAMLFKIYITAFLEFLENPEALIKNDPERVEKIRGVFERQHVALEELMGLSDYKEITVKFKHIADQEIAILGDSKIKQGNIFIRTWDDVFATVETANAASFLQGPFTKWVENRTRQVLHEITEIDIQTFRTIQLRFSTEI